MSPGQACELPPCSWPPTPATAPPRGAPSSCSLTVWRCSSYSSAPGQSWIYHLPSTVLLSPVCRLRSSLDHSLQLAPAQSTGWTDCLERVAVEMGVQSNTVTNRYRRGLLGLGDYYEEAVIGGQRRLVGQCREREAR